ncbi:acyl-CoA dehydrogenase family protein [Micromonospora sp. WMMA1949]|uniref:acyl-CoA dehydrogenase family protein n=1 Tax=unclassified Micromonospora TaxID=2617518 RepID=UPI0022B6A8D5|nr:acyl-CoA dehydrogenase family protein [Micromonospora sp. WMMA1949]MCZ7428583.1 acyl-CoA dehydrogenase family protein [Micromonospora sp. WMMA1949]
MDLELDPDQLALGRAVGGELDRFGDDQLPGPVHDRLAGLQLYALEAPAAAGGLELGLGYAVVVCDELGRRVAPDGYRAAALLLDLLGGQDAALARDRGAAVVAGTVRVALSGGTDDADVVVAVDGAGALRAVHRRSGALWAEVAGTGPAGRPPRPLYRARVRQAAYLSGLAARAHRLAVERAAQRHQFGQALLSHQAIAFSLARQLAHLRAARLLVHEAAWRDDTGAPAGLAATRALAYASELALEITAAAVHVHGALGLTGSAPVHRYYRAAAVEALRFGRPAELWRAAGRWERSAEEAG